MRTLWWVIACVACSSDPEPPKWEPPPSCEWLRDPEDLAPGDGVSWLGTRVGYLYWVRNLEDRRELLRVPIAGGEPETIASLSLIHISEPTRLLSISYAVFC